jgi:hypothetical protein
MNKIPEANDLAALAAARGRNIACERLFRVQFGLAFVSAVGVGAVCARFEKMRIFAAVATLLLVLLDAILEKVIDCGKAEAARFQELYDIAVFGLPWPRLKAGEPPSASEVYRWETVYRSRDPDLEQLKNWYPLAPDLPPTAARLICQHAIITWNRGQQRIAGWFYIGVVTLFIIALISLPAAMNLAHSQVLFFIAPASPLIVLCSRFYLEHAESVEAYARIERYSEEVWARFLSGEGDRITIDHETRLIQDELFDQRCRRPIVFARVYRWIRPSYERQMSATSHRRILAWNGRVSIKPPFNPKLK